MGWVAQGELMPELDQAIFALPVGHVSEPIRTKLGLHLVWVEDRKTADDLSVTQAHQEVYQRLYQQKFQAAMAKWLNELRRTAYIAVASDWN
jgi:peptidyl-prolyl cis-trans isomerase SurA